MTETYRGHEIEQVYVYKDTEQLVKDNVNRACGYCGLENTPEGHDGCLGTLPNVMNACCGHGRINEAYVQFGNNSVIRGHIAIDIQGKLKSLEEPE